MPKSILVVDDEGMIAETVAHIFQRCGYETRSATSGEEAVKIIQSVEFDLAVLDFAMKGMNGLQVASILNLQQPLCKLLMMSGYPLDDALFSTISFRIDFLQKPVHPTDLLDTVKGLIGQAEGSHPQTLTDH